MLPFLPIILGTFTGPTSINFPLVIFRAALVGANGLGKPVVRALNTVNIAQGFEAGLAIVIVAILLDRFFKLPGAGRTGG